MFQGDQTNDHFSPCEGPILLWSSFLASLHFHFNPFFSLDFFSIHFSSTFFLGSLSSIFALLLLTHTSRRGELNNFWNSIFSHIFLPASSIWSLIAREEISLCFCPLMWKMILGRDIGKIYQVQKGWLWIIFLYHWKDDESWPFLISNIVT